jgi:hypothetical protein
MYWQWSDGGWNSDKRPAAETSTSIHTLFCMRALALCGDHTGSTKARGSALGASEVFRSRRLFKRFTSGVVIKPKFVALHYPRHWHYDVLGALKAFAKIGLTDDDRCNDPLDLLEEKEPQQGGWAAERRFYKKPSSEFQLNADYIATGHDDVPLHSLTGLLPTVSCDQALVGSGFPQVFLDHFAGPMAGQAHRSDAS